MNRVFGILFAVILGVLVAISAWPASKANFSGTWTLNQAESDYSNASASIPDRLTRTIQQAGDHLKYRVEREKAGRKGSFEVELDIGSGTPYESDAAGIVTAEWKAEALVLHTLFNPGSDRQSEQTETWSLSGDGKKIIDDFVYITREGKKISIRRVFDKVAK